MWIYVIYMCIYVIYANSSYIIIFVMQNRKNRPKFYLFQLCHLPRGKQVAKLESHEPWHLCHLPIKAVGKESFATCQYRQSAKNSLPPANKDSRQRISVLKKIKTAFATCPSKQLAKKFCYKKIRKAFADCRAAVGKRDALCHLTTAYVSFTDCHADRWQRLCRLVSTWQVAKVYLPMNFLLHVLC